MCSVGGSGDGCLRCEGGGEEKKEVLIGCMKLGSSVGSL